MVDLVVAGVVKPTEPLKTEVRVSRELLVVLVVLVVVVVMVRGLVPQLRGAMRRQTLELVAVVRPDAHRWPSTGAAGARGGNGGSGYVVIKVVG